ncbi:MAG: DUF362 domain-containing protein [Desulfobacterales bacterium]|nr:DUF362 domain-containing protein [Desulfobacterales bacterium]
MKTNVYLSKVERYDLNHLISEIHNGIQAIGFDLGQLHGAKVAIKPNLLLSAPPDKAIVTHPIFFHSVVQLVKQFGGIPILIESPAFSPLEKVLQKTGYMDIIEAEGVTVITSIETDTIRYDNGIQYKRFDINKAFFDVDIIFNLPKFKTHGFTYLTAAVKNLFGSLPGLHKSRMHMKAPSKHEFNHFLLDLYGAFLFGFTKPKPILHIMDAILALEGEGPGHSGKPKQVGALILGEDAIACDYVAAQITKLDVKEVFTITYGFEREFGINSGDEITVVGQRIEDLQVHDFQPTHSTIFSHLVRWPFTSKTFKNCMVERPLPLAAKCTGCLQCKKICPVSAISAPKPNAKIPQYDYKTCIRCFCCMEVCPEAAIVISKPFLLKLLGLVSNRS